MVRRVAALVFVTIAIGFAAGDIGGAKRPKSSLGLSLVSESVSFRREQE